MLVELVVAYRMMRAGGDFRVNVIASILGGFGLMMILTGGESLLRVFRRRDGVPGSRLPVG